MLPCQVKPAFNRIILRSFLRCKHTPPEAGVLYRLEKRALLRVKGATPELGEASTFLQGLITNDMRHFEDGTSCVYAMFLNTKGRVLYDTLVHSAGEKDTFLLECDHSVLSDLKKHLTVYRLRKKVDIDDISKDYKVLSLLGANNETNIDIKGLTIHKDPRMQALGHRVIAPAQVEEDKISSSLINSVSLGDPHEYTYLRYKLGVGEGAEDLPPGSCIPLEANCDYLHGVSFHKGCYIGQELTARVHHTGIVRKRFMPMKFETPPSENIPSDSLVSLPNPTDPKSKIGKVRGVVKDYGLVLVNVAEALQAKALEVCGCKGIVERPTWWPVEASKEKAGAAKAAS